MLQEINDSIEQRILEENKLIARAPKEMGWGTNAKK